MRAQVSIELLFTLGMIIAFTIPVVLLLFSLSQIGIENVILVQAEGNARSLADSINEVYTEGALAKRTVLLNLPTSTEKIIIGNNEVTIIVTTTSGKYHAIAPIFADVGEYPLVLENNNGLVPRGLVPVVLSVDENNKVMISV